MTPKEKAVNDDSQTYDQEMDDEDHSLTANGGLHSSKNTFRAAVPQILAASAQNILLLSYGMTLGFPTIVIPALLEGGGDTLRLAKDQVSWFSSINLITVPVGCLFSGTLTSRLGRKPMMMFVNAPMIAAWIMFYYADSVAVLYASLVLTGLSGGLLEAPTLTYVAEITQPHLRGMLCATSCMSVILGVFIQLLMGSLLEWRTVAAVNLVFPVAAFISLCFVPESPAWFVGKGRLADAERSLCWLRGWRQPSEVHVELRYLVSSLAESSKIKTNAWRNYTHHTFLKPFLVVSMAFLISHFAGLTTLQTFAVTIFQALESPIDEYVATFYLGVLQLVGSMICVILVHWTGKRPLMFFSSIGNGICFIIVATHAYMASDKMNYSVEGYSWIPVTFLLLAAFTSHVGIRLLPWILIGEVFPQRVRNISAGLTSSIGYIFGFTVNKVYVYMVDGMTLAGSFWFYGAVSVLGAVYFYYYLPETEGRTLTEIEQHFDGKNSLLTKSVKCSERRPEGNEFANENKRIVLKI